MTNREWKKHKEEMQILENVKRAEELLKMKINPVEEVPKAEGVNYFEDLREEVEKEKEWIDKDKRGYN